MLNLLRAILVCVVPGQVPPGVDVEIATVAGLAQLGPLVSIDAQGVSLEVAGQLRKITFDQVLSIVPQGASTPPTTQTPTVFIETVDGGLLAPRSVVIDADKATIEMSRTWEVPRRVVSAVRFRPLADAAAAQWRELAQQVEATDRVILEREGQLDFLEGVIESVDHDSVTFRLDDSTRELPRAKLTGVVFHRAPAAESAKLIARAADRVGSILPVSRLELIAGGLRIHAPAGWTAELAWGDVQKLDFSHGKLCYLSELVPESSTVTIDPLWELPGSSDLLRESWDPRFDRGFFPGPLRLGQKKYARGVTLRSRTQIVYRLPEGFHRFQATVGIDDHVRPEGNATFRIRGDDSTLFESQLTGRNEPVSVDVDVEKQNRLTIVVESGGDGDVADIVVVALARLTQ